MVAVAAYAIPDPAQDKVASWIRSTVAPTTRPYVLATSQWQQWNLFSPDPQRRVTEYRLVADGQTRLRLTPSTYRWWRKTDEIAMFSKWEDEEAETVDPLLKRYVAAYCEPLGMPPGSRLSLQGRYTYLPIPTRANLHYQPPDLSWLPFTSVTVDCDAHSALAPVFHP